MTIGKMKFWNPKVRTPKSQIFHKLSALVPPTTPTRQRYSSAPVKIDAGALLMLAPLAKQRMIFSVVSKASASWN